MVLPGASFCRGVEHLYYFLNHKLLGMKRKALKTLQLYTRPPPAVRSDPSEPKEFFEWCRHHEVQLPYTNAVAVCSESMYGAHPGIPMHVYLDQRRGGGHEVIDMTAYEPSWGMPVHVAMDRLLKMDNALSLAGDAVYRVTCKLFFNSWLHRVEALRRAALFYSPTVFPWMEMDRTYCAYHALQLQQLHVLSNWNLTQHTVETQSNIRTRRLTILRSARPALVRELQALRVTVNYDMDVCTLKAMMMDAMGWQLPPRYLWSKASIAYIRRYVLCSTMATQEPATWEEAAAELDQDILNRFPRGLPLQDDGLYGKRCRDDVCSRHKHAVRNLRLTAAVAQSRFKRRALAYRHAFDFVHLWDERNKNCMQRSAWVILKLGFRPSGTHLFRDHLFRNMRTTRRAARWRNCPLSPQAS